MSEVYQLLNVGMHVPGYQRRKLWVEVAAPVVIGDRLTLTLLTIRKQGERSLYSVINAPDVHFEAEIPAATFIDATGWAGMLILPRAALLSDNGGFLRVFVEFVSMREEISFAL